MSHKSAIITLSLAFLCLHFCPLEANNGTENKDLTAAFQSFSKKAITEMLAQRRYLQDIGQTLAPLIEQLNNGTNPMETNSENIRVLARAMQSLGSEIEALESRKSADSGMVTSQCGGFIPLDGEDTQEIIYRIPPGFLAANCIWVLWPKNGGQIRIRNELSSNVHFDSSFALSVAHNFSARGWQKTLLPVGSENMLGDNGSQFTFALLFFQAKVTKLGQGVHLKLHEAPGAQKVTSFRPNFKQLSLSKSSGKLRYPSGSSYENNERVFAIGRVPEGKSLRVKVDRVNTEKDLDWFRIMWLDSTLFSNKHTGVTASGTPTLIPGGCSYIIVFVSDGSKTGEGIQFSYSLSESDVL